MFNVRHRNVSIQVSSCQERFLTKHKFHHLLLKFKKGRKYNLQNDLIILGTSVFVVESRLSPA